MELLLGNCLDRLKDLEDNSVDAIVTDPPYGLSFMGKRWDYDVPSVDIWKECLRVLKPGGYLLSFAGTRTQHRMAVNIEDAGFEIRDMIAWVYGSGFPKSLNIGKAVDKLQGNEREVVGKTQSVQFQEKGYEYKGDKKGSGFNNEKYWGFGNDVTKGTSEWEGWGTALKPALEPITVARKPLGEKTVAENCLKWGVGGINIDASRVRGEYKWRASDSKIDGDIFKQGSFGEKPNELGRFPANLIHDGSDEVRECFPETKTGGKIPDKKDFDNSDVMLKKWQGRPETINKFANDSGNASRFFKTCNYSLKHDTMSIWKTTFVDTAERLLRITQVIKESTVPLSVGDLQEEQNDQLVKSAVSHANSIEILIALVLVRIKNLASSPEGLLAIQDSIGNCKECTQLLSLVLCVIKEGNTDITQITTSLWKSFGSANPVITNSIQETKKSELKRFAYIPKASKRERNIGCEGLEKKVGVGNFMAEAKWINDPRSPNGGYEAAPSKPQSNSHPTVKPIALMEYLVKLVSREGQVILDPFMGSGTTGMACKKLDREFIGIEMMPEYMEIAKCRIEGVKKKEQLNMI